MDPGRADFGRPAGDGSSDRRPGGGHIGIGIGDYPCRELGWPTNAGLVHEVIRTLHSLGRESALPDQARELLGLSSRQTAVAARTWAPAAFHANPDTTTAHSRRLLKKA